jgi:hypothetical protein
LPRQVREQQQRGRERDHTFAEAASYDALAENDAAKWVMKSAALGLVDCEMRRDNSRHVQARLDENANPSAPFAP